MNELVNTHVKFEVLLLLLFLMLFAVSIEVKAGDDENDIYDLLDEKVKNNFYEGLDNVEKQEKTIEITGNIPERIMRSLACTFYKNLDAIKAGSLLAGTLSFLGGFVVFKVVKLNKGMKRYAISVFMITIPLALFIFVYAISLFINLFVS